MTTKIPILIFIAITTYSNVISQENLDSWRYWDNGVGYLKTWIFADVSESTAVEIKRRWNAIGDSLKTSSNPFAGTYLQDGNRGYYLRWSPEKGFVYVRYYESFVEDASYGDVSKSRSEILFFVSHELEAMSDRRKIATPTRWIPTMDGRFLIRSDEIKEFADFYGGFGNFNGFPRKWNCDCDAFARRVDKDVRYPKPPFSVVPDAFRKFIRNPISGRIVAVGKRYVGKHPIAFTIDEIEGKASMTVVTIDKGSRDGVTKGLLFLIGTDQDAMQQVLRITRVSKTRSNGLVIRMLGENGLESFVDGWEDKTDKPIYKIYLPIRKGTPITTGSATFFE